MKIQLLHDNLKNGTVPIPSVATEGSAGYDIYMPESGWLANNGDEQRRSQDHPYRLGFATEIPPGCLGIVLPRSGVGSKYGIEVTNTAGLIDSDFRGEWIASLMLKKIGFFEWERGDKILQFIIVPIFTPKLEVVDELSNTTRGHGGYGSTGR